MGTTEVANELGVSKTNLSKIPDLPEPDQRLLCGRIWRASVIREFAVAYRARQRGAVREAA
jgi:hypothetical protein